MKKKLFSILLCGLLFIGVSGCDNKGLSQNSTQKDNSKISTLECNKLKKDNWTEVSSEYTITFKNNEFENAIVKQTMTILSEWYRKTTDEYLEAIERLYSGYSVEVISKNDESITYTIKFDTAGVEQHLDTRIIGSDISSYQSALEDADYSCVIK